MHVHSRTRAVLCPASHYDATLTTMWTECGEIMSFYCISKDQTVYSFPCKFKVSMVTDCCGLYSLPVCICNCIQQLSSSARYCVCLSCVYCRYLVTFSPLPDNSKEEPQAVIIWDVRTGYRKRSFQCENASAWPIFKSVFNAVFDVW